MKTNKFTRAFGLIITLSALLFSAYGGNSTTFMKLKVSGNGYSDETVLRFNPDATTGFDANYDAYKLGSINPKVPRLSTLSINTDYSINTLPEINGNVNIPVRLITGLSGTFTLTKDATWFGAPGNNCMTMKDLLTGNIVDLRTNFSYTFTLSDTTSAPRFLISISSPLSVISVPAKCYGSANGMGIATGAGTGLFNYHWQDIHGNILQSHLNVLGNDTLKNLAEGMYFVSLNGNCGSATDTVRITNPSQITSKIISTDISCYGTNDGAVSLDSVNGGTGSYTFLWSNGDTSNSITNLGPGVYDVTVRDNNGCAFKSSAIVNEPLQITSVLAPTDLTCYASNDGSISLGFINGGSAPYSYEWSNGETGKLISGLSAGIYSVTITDSKGCSKTFSEVVNPGVNVISGFSTDQDTILLNRNPAVNFTNTSANGTSFTWNFGDGSTPEYSTNPSHRFTSAGTFRVTLIAENGICSSTESKDLIVIDNVVTGLSSLVKGKDISMVNNEEGTSLMFNLDKVTNVRISAYNVLGQAVIPARSISIGTGIIKLDLPTRNGIYFINVNTTGNSVSFSTEINN
jgi:hypothetical protein